MHKGAQQWLNEHPEVYSRKELAKDVLISLAYTLLLLALLKSKVLEPLPNYLRGK